MSTLIQWTDVTDNIIVVKGGGWWCRKCSEGCDNCYSAALNQSDYFGGNHLAYTGEAPELELRREIIFRWTRQRKPKKHFVASMTDVFGEWVPEQWAFEMLDGMRAAPLQTFQVLTKRASVMARSVLAWLALRGLDRVPNNIWLGFSAENQHWFDLRATHALRLRDVCSVLWVSAEPLLGPLSPRLCPRDRNNDGDCDRHPNGCPQLDWCVCGGESGKGARPCDVNWIDDIVTYCLKRGLAAYVKQLGARPIQNVQSPMGDLHPLVHKKGGDINEWPEELRIRQFPGGAAEAVSVESSGPSAPFEKGLGVGQPDANLQEGRSN